MFNFLKSGLLWTALLFVQPVLAADLFPVNHEARLQDTLTHTYTHILGLKPIPDSYHLAKATFLPEFQDKEIGWAGNEITDSANQGGQCGGYELTVCPAHGNCSSCPFDRRYKRLTGCTDGYTIKANSCQASSCSVLGYQADIPANNICSKITEGSLTCYKDCKPVSCSAYPLNCDTFNIANSSGKAMCPDCESNTADCSPKLCKVSSCMDGFKIADNGTTCMALDDTCPNGYFKSCETGTQGEPELTEKGTPCYQCKPKEPACPEGYYPLNEEGYSHNFVYGKECQDKRQFIYYDFYSEDVSYGGRIIPQSYIDKENCKTLSISLPYGKLLQEARIVYYEPTAEQISSPETIVTSCDEFETALKDSSVYNIRISGKITCHNEKYNYTYGGHKSTPNGYLIYQEKNIYGTNRNSDILEFTGNEPYLAAAALRLSNLTLDIPTNMNSLLLSTVPELELSPYILTVAENINIIGGTNSLKQNIFFKSGDNHLYFKYKQPSDGLGHGSIAIGNNAKVYFHGMDGSSMTFEDIFLLGELTPTENLIPAYANPYADNLFMQGKNKTYYGRGITLNNGSFIDFTRWPSTHLHIVGNNSSVTVENTADNIAIGDNSSYSATERVYSPNIAMGRNAKFYDNTHGYTHIQAQTTNNYNGEYTYITTSDWKNTANFY